MTHISYYRSDEGKRFLDEVQDEAYVRSSLHGDAWVEKDSRIPIRCTTDKVQISIASRHADAEPSADFTYANHHNVRNSASKKHYFCPESGV